jgi:hypothetical protein
VDYLLFIASKILIQKNKDYVITKCNFASLGMNLELSASSPESDKQLSSLKNQLPYSELDPALPVLFPAP